MKVRQNPSLLNLNTFGLDGTAGLLYEIECEEDLLALPAFDSSRDFILGGGSNVVLVSDIPGAVYLNRISGIDVVAEDEAQVMVEAGAGENWHQLVRWSVDRGLAGLENLSLIPGSAGAAPVQNIGAYGVELASLIERVTAWDLQRQQWIVFQREDCRFAYRDSLFKSGDPDRYLITSIRLALNKAFEPVLHYAGLKEELDHRNVSSLTPRVVSDAVCALRQRKLPDPEQEGNAGSFFKNPVVSRPVAEKLLARYENLPAWPQPGGDVRLSAAWMIDYCGLKGARVGGAAVSTRHALVLVNTGDASGSDVATLAKQVQLSVEQSFDVVLEPEPRLVDFKADCRDF